VTGGGLNVLLGGVFASCWKVTKGDKTSRLFGVECWLELTTAPRGAVLTPHY
jgi:hypothetical protein